MKRAAWFICRWARQATISMAGSARDKIFSASRLVCLDANTGKRKWHFQTVHHGLWDYDLPAPPNLVTLNVGGRKIDAAVQLTKMGFIFVFDRVTGAPVFPNRGAASARQAMFPAKKPLRRSPFP